MSPEIRVAPPDLSKSFLDFEEVRVTPAQLDRPPVIKLLPPPPIQPPRIEGGAGGRMAP